MYVHPYVHVYNKNSCGKVDAIESEYSSLPRFAMRNWNVLLMPCDLIDVL